MDDLILRVIADLSDLRYGDAIVRGREVMAYARPMMSPAQASLLHTVIAAAFDSAIKELEAAIHVKPDVVLPVELAWDGLDSLLTVARSRSFAVVVQAAAAETEQRRNGYRVRVTVLP